MPPKTALLGSLLLLTLTVGVSSYFVQISTGFFEEELPMPSYFDTVYHLVYSFKYPLWKNLDMTLRDWRSLCKSDSYSPSYTCVVFFYYERVIERLQYEIVQHNIKTFGGQNLSDITPKLDFCNDVQRHFTTMMTSKSSVDKYFDYLRACPRNFFDLKTGISDYVYDIKGPYKKMLERFDTEFTNHLNTQTSKPWASESRHGPASYVNQLLADQSLMLNQYWMESERWEKAYKSCSLQQIPTTLLKASNLTSALRKIQSQVSKSGYDLSLPIGDLSQYLLYSLADCTFTEEQDFIVRIQVPLRKRSFKPKLIKTQAIPFMLNTGVFETAGPTEEDSGDLSICVKSDMDANYIWDPVTEYLSETDCQPGVHLCPIHDNGDLYNPHLCAPAYFSKDPFHIRKHCLFECERLTDEPLVKLPIFRRMSSNVYTITGTEDHRIYIQNGQQQAFLDMPKLGALEVTLCCNCTLRYGDQIFYSENPCSTGNSSAVINLVPGNFFKYNVVEALGGFNGALLDFNSFNKSVMNSAYFSEPHGEELELHEQIAHARAAARAVSNGGGGGGSLQMVVIWIALVLQTVLIVLVIVMLYKKGVFEARGSLIKRIRFSNRREGGASTENISDYM